MYKVKIFGAGSIGNHLANAAVSLGWHADICDIDPEALKRTKNEIYPTRYGKWNDQIGLFLNNEAPKGIYDFIFIGTPPKYHIPLALEALEEKPKLILIEKPFCTPDLELADELYHKAKAMGVIVLTGYDHVVGYAGVKMEEIIRSGVLGKIETIDVEFREYWGGIFAAHPWLDGPADSYLGYWEQGGGATGEHSHAINLWQHFAHVSGCGRVTEVSAMMEFAEVNGATYDKIGVINLKTERGLVGRVVQDVVTKPTRKWGRIQAENAFAEWLCGNKPGTDTVLLSKDSKGIEEFPFSKTRPEDFICELKHVQKRVEGQIDFSGLEIDRGLDTMLVIAAAYQSAKTGKTVKIDYSKGYSRFALI